MSKRLRGLGRRIVRLAAAAFALQVLVGAFGMPDALVRWITGRNATLRQAPDSIVVLGGSGIPSETGLIRSYYGAKYAQLQTNATVLIALPTDKDPDVTSVGRMRDELVMRGVARERIHLETRGMNTHQQAINVAAMLGSEAIRRPVLLVTSPSHVRRALLCFRKAGFRQVGAAPSEDTDNEADAGRYVRPRYSFWSTLQFEVQVARELTAMAVYWMKGWI